jgi:RNA polymerase sigma-70 factor (ECF subfamily)
MSSRRRASSWATLVVELPWLGAELSRRRRSLSCFEFDPEPGELVRSSGSARRTPESRRAERWARSWWPVGAILCPGRGPAIFTDLASLSPAIAQYACSMVKLMEQNPNSKDLFEAARNGDRLAFDQLVARDRDRLRALVLSRLEKRLALDVDPDDVYQETILRALENAAKLEWRGEGSFLRWLGGIVENVILELARKRARQKGVSLDADLPGRAVSASRAARREDRFDRLEQSLENLSPDHRQVILLVRIRGLSFDEAGRCMGRSSGAVKKLLYRALHELKDSFGDTESLGLPERGLDEASLRSPSAPQREEGET